MYLHEDRETFRDLILQVADKNGRTPIVVEKDYYVTLILRLLSEKLDQCVFKGGTSLSKGFHVIDRFSEDIDITFDEHIGESRRKKLKNVVLKGISEELGMPISNWNDTQSDRDYNAYHFSYSSVFDLEASAMPGVNVPDIITQFCDKAFYEDDYQSITSYFAADFVPYEDTITKMREIAAESLFVEA